MKNIKIKGHLLSPFKYINKIGNYESKSSLWNSKWKINFTSPLQLLFTNSKLLLFIFHVINVYHKILLINVSLVFYQSHFKQLFY